jgi:ankyrin repeat protein
MSNNLPKVQDMLSQGANPNLPDSYGFSALHYACTEGFPEIGELLLQSKANPNAQTYSSQTTPLHRAAYRGHSQIVLLLLKYGADPFLKGSNFLNPFLILIRF